MVLLRHSSCDGGNPGACCQHCIRRLSPPLQFIGARSFPATAVCESRRPVSFLEWDCDSRNLLGTVGDGVWRRHLALDTAVRGWCVSLVHAVAIGNGCALVAGAGEAPRRAGGPAEF